jgi:predicted  nucleic acid-binding Zn-ribbon protein
MLILQDRDMKLQQVEGQLAALPAERAACQAKIQELRSQIEGSRQRLLEMEARAKSIEGEMAALEEKMSKYKRQQVLVKKNDEYQALTHEIAAAAAGISQLESDELELLYALDEARKAHAVEVKLLEEKIALEDQGVARLDEKEERCRGELDGARSAKEEAEAAVDRAALSKYRQVARGIRFPIVVELADHRCGGCHMKVSAAIDSDVRAAEEITTCDNCGRILYSER